MNKNLLFSYLAGTVLGMAAVLPGAAQHTAQAPAEAVGDAARITVRLDRISERTVSDRLLGFNIVYAKNPDSLWRSGVLEKAIRDVRPGFLRYPGGTVNTYFHWEHPTGNGWEDLWDPQYDTARNRPPEEFMDIDEYMALVRRTGAEPLLGINVNSGFRWNRVEEGVQEALRLMKYCRDKGFKVKYWFMGNEPYMHDCNGGAVTPARYGEMINAFVPRMKEFDPDIKIIANWHATFRKHGRQYDELFAVAGPQYRHHRRPLVLHVGHGVMERMARKNALRSISGRFVCQRNRTVPRDRGPQRRAACPAGQSRMERRSRKKIRRSPSHARSERAHPSRNDDAVHAGRSRHGYILAAVLGQRVRIPEFFRQKDRKAAADE